jgi:hypothetical protein
MKSLYNRITGGLSNIGREHHRWLAAGLLLTMAILGLGSMLGNSATFDEVAHIPAGYSYLHYNDYRLNPEHPPLIKDLAGLPLQFMNLKFPLDQPSWMDDVNGQWATGHSFIYYLGNNADSILFWARLPIFILALAFGGFLYVFSRRRWGTAVALLALFFYTLSPNFLAHSTLVTTDLAAAELTKFSAILLYPLLGLATLVYVWVSPQPRKLWERLHIYTGGFVVASALSFLWMWIYYIPQVWKMPLSVQDRLIDGSLGLASLRPAAEMLMGLNDLPFMRPVAQYLLGVVMVFGRIGGGNDTYFNGQMTAHGSHFYFLELFALKTQVPLLIMLVAVLALVIWRAAKRGWSLGRLAGHIRGHVLEWTLGFFGVFYFVVSVAGSLNLGIRHILPIYLPLFVLVAVGVVRGWRWVLKRVRVLPAAVAFAALLVWYGASTILVYPSYISYFNEIIGGSANAGGYFTDSSVDWGQDLKRLKTYVGEHPEIKHIAVDYFGGGDPAYYFCQRRYDSAGQLVTSSMGYDCSHSVYEPWHSRNGEYTGQYIAVSETFLENDHYYSARYHLPSYAYLWARQPVAKIGGSIYVYKLY